MFDTGARRNFPDCLMKGYDTLSHSESTMVSKYIGDYGKRINEAIIFDKVDPTFTTNIVDLNNALEKLPKTEECIVYRNFDFSDQQVQRALDFLSQNLGKIIRIRTFLSTTRHVNLTGNSDDYSLVFKIQIQSQGRSVDIAKLLTECGVHNTEKEVLFPTNSLFRICDVGTDNRTVICEEVILNTSETVQDFPQF